MPMFECWYDQPTIHPIRTERRLAICNKAADELGIHVMPPQPSGTNADALVVLSTKHKGESGKRVLAYVLQRKPVIVFPDAPLQWHGKYCGKLIESTEDYLPIVMSFVKGGLSEMEYRRA